MQEVFCDTLIDFSQVIVWGVKCGLCFVLPLLFCKSHEEAVLHLQLNQYGRIAVPLDGSREEGSWQGGQEDWICLLPSLLFQCPLCLHSLICWEYPSCCRKKGSRNVGQDQEERAGTAFQTTQPIRLVEPLYETSSQNPTEKENIYSMLVCCWFFLLFFS